MLKCVSMPERMTAKKVTIKNLTGGEWVQQDGMDPSYVVAANGQKVSRARILATVVSKFVSDDKNFGSVTLDDGTDTMRAKVFKDMGPIERAEQGQLFDVIGKVREYNGEIYLMPEVMRRVDDPNFLLLRRLELARQEKDTPAEVEAMNEEEKPPTKSEELRKQLLELIDAEKAGITYEELIKKSRRSENEVDSAVNELLSEGICYEPTPGKIKKI